MNNSSLFDESTFYTKYTRDLVSCNNEIIIESPFITNKRMGILWPIFERLIQNNKKIYIVTRDPREHSANYATQSETEIQKMESLGIQVFICSGKHHRKLAIIDRTILWEGSLNILSHHKSREIMRRINDREATEEMFNFLKFKRYI